MADTEQVWRTQCVKVEPDKDRDPVYTVFIGPIFNGKVLESVDNPALVRLSELKDPLDLHDAVKVRAVHAARDAKEKAERDKRAKEAEKTAAAAAKN